MQTKVLVGCLVPAVFVALFAIVWFSVMQAHKKRTKQLYDWNETYWTLNQQLQTEERNKQLNLPIYVINLKRAPKRRTFIQDQMNRLQCKNVTFVNAVDGRDIEQESQQCYVHPESGLKIQLSSKKLKVSVLELACTVSHMLAIKTAYENGDDFAVISEDDVSWVLAPYWRKSLRETATLAQADVVHLFHHTTNQPGFLTITPKNLRKFWGTQAYIISRQGMMQIIDACFQGPHELSFPDLDLRADKIIYMLLEKAVAFQEFPVIFPLNASQVETSIIHRIDELRHIKSAFRVIKLQDTKNKKKHNV